MMKMILSLAAMAALMLTVGCAPDADNASADAAVGTTVAASGEVLCGACGHAKGSQACCSDECAKCDKCGMHAGSELCCAVASEAAGQDMCAKCGHAASENCCADECKTCEQCGKHAGSALCCQQAGQTEAAATEPSTEAEANTEPETDSDSDA